MSKRKWYAKPIYALVALALVLSFSLVTAVPVAAGDSVVVLRVEPTTGMSVEVGESFDLEVWARFSTGGHSWNAADVIFQWDSNYLQLNGGTFSTTFSMAFWPGHPINDTWDDGDAGITLWAFVNEITEDQLLITLHVVALAPVESTMFNVVHDVGPGPSTMVIEPYTWVDLSGTYYGADIEIVPPPIEVDIDIKPGSDPNSINLKSKGVVPVAVLTTEDFDASTVDPETVGFLTTKNYSDVTLSNWGQGNFDEVWALTQGDLTLSYTLDMSAIASAGWAVTEVGLRETGGPNIDPNLVGGWMQSNYISATSNPDSLNMNDMHLLSKHGWLHQQYDAEDADTLITPYWSGDNYGFWFDRDGVDQWQANLWGNIDGATYNTEGVYEITITYHAIDDNTGTMFATINGVQQGLYIGGWKDAQPEFYPAGRSFTGDMTQMQVFYGRGGGGGEVTVSDITVTGRLAAGAVRWTMEDVDGDGDLDLLLHFKTQALGLSKDSTEATLTCATYGGQPIQGTDTVNIVPKGKGKK